MKFRFSQLALAALAADVSTAFIPSQNTGIQTQCTSRHGEFQSTLFASAAMAPPATDAESAYAEWRAKFGKGDFDADRFNNFKNNFEMLTQANLEARDKAVSEGKTPPGWMTLNEFGDFSSEEYAAQNQQSGAVTKDDFLEMEKALEYVASISQTTNGALSPENAEKLQALYRKSAGAYEGWCAQYGKEANSGRFEAFANNYAALVVFSERTGKSLELNEYADCSKEEYALILDGSLPNGDDDVKPATSKRKTFFIKDSKKRKTELIPGADATSSGRATLVIKGAGSSVRGTQVIRSADEATKGTQVVRRAGVPPPVQGTQVISRAGGNSIGTQVIKAANAQGPVSGTKVIQPANPQGPVRGTKVIKPANAVSPIKGTRVLKKKVLGTRVVRAEDEDPAPVNGDDVATRGTRVIKRQIPGPASTNGYDVRATTAMDGSAVDKPSDGSLFGGKKLDSNSETTVRGTIVLQRKSSQPQPAGQRQTLLVSKTEIDGTAPSVFSFFGGADTRNAAARGTIVIKKNKNNYHQYQDRVKKEQQSEIQKAVEAKRMAAMRRRDALLKKPRKTVQTEDSNAEAAPTPQLLAGPPDMPQMLNWVQNEDGSITGNIYNAKNFKDGTKITTSPIPNAAKSGFLVKTTSGTRYLMN